MERNRIADALGMTERHRNAGKETFGNPFQVEAKQRDGGVHIVPMTCDHLPDVLAIERESQPEPWSEVSFAEELARCETSALVARYCGAGRDQIKEGCPASAVLHYPEGGESRICGYICFWIVADELQILNISVHGAFRRKGIGQSLLLRAIEAGVANGAREVVLEMRKSNTGARKFYEKAGFRDVGERPGYYGPGEEAAVLMEMVLDPPAGSSR